MPMKVLLGTAYFESHRGGIEIVAGRLARELTARGHVIMWLAADATPPPAESGLGVSATPLSAWNVTERRLGVPFPLPSASALAAIVRQVKAADILLLHDALYPTNVAAMIVARWHRKPVVIVQHIGLVPYRNAMLRGLMAAADAVVARSMLRAADQTVFVSEVVARHFEGVRFRSPTRIILNGVDAQLFKPAADAPDKAKAREQFALPATGDLVLFVGRFVEKKGLHIIERVARQRPGVSFALAGWGPLDPQSWRLPNVHVLTGLDQRALVAVYHASDALLLPSIGEGLPLVIQEAMSCGLPVICGSETARADAAMAGLVSGVEVDAGDADATAERFALCLDRVLDDARSPRAEAARAARRAFAEARYDWSVAADTYDRLLTGVAQSARASASPVAISAP